jgi:hypothetical protein
VSRINLPQGGNRAAQAGSGGSSPSLLPLVPLELDPCAVQQWMDQRDEWLLALHPKLTARELTDLYTRYVNSPCPITDVLCEIAAHPNTPENILREILRGSDQELHHALAANPNLPSAMLAVLAHSPANDVLEHVIWHPRTPIGELERLARKRRSAVVRRWADEALTQWCRPR